MERTHGQKYCKVVVMIEAETLPVYKGKDSKDLSYRLTLAAEPSNSPLLVILHGHGPNPKASKFNDAKWNVLAPIDDYGLDSQGSWWLGKDDDPFVLEMLHDLIASIQDEHTIKKGLFFWGSSMGGYGALLHGLLLNATAVYANIPQIRLLGSTYSNTSMKDFFQKVISSETSKYNDITNFLDKEDPRANPLFFLAQGRYDYPRYLEEQLLSLMEACLKYEINFHLEIFPEKGHKLFKALHEAVAMFEEYFPDEFIQSDDVKAEQLSKEVDVSESSDYLGVDDLSSLIKQDWHAYALMTPKNRYPFLKELYKRERDTFLADQLKSDLSDKNRKKGEELIENLYRFDRFEAVVLPLRLTWKEDPFKNRNWQWQLHKWSFYIGFLAAYDATKEEKYLNRLEELIISWYECNYTDDRPSEMSWHDHATALRLGSLIYIWEYIRTSDYRMSDTSLMIIINMVETHCDILSTEKFYMRHNNHGFDQSLFLYLASVNFPTLKNADKWHAIGLERLLDEIGIAFTSEGMHIENSPSYLIGMLQRVDLVSKMLHHYEHKEDLGLDALVNDSLRCLAYLIHPDGSLPMLGDTDHSTRVYTMNHLKQYGNFQLFQYVQTKAKKGLIGEHIPDAVFAESGYAVFRDGWHTEDTFDSMIHLVFKCGFLSNFHRHDDDLNFILMGMGEYWFVDGGIYNYAEQDPYRLYLRSDKAHNIPVLADVKASRRLMKEKEQQASIIDHCLSHDISWVKAQSFMYPGFRMTRKIEYIRPERFIITDKVMRDDGEVTPYELMFHIPLDKEIIINEDASVDIIGKRSNRTHMSFDGEGDLSFELLSGINTTEYLGWQSKEFNKVEPVYTLRCKVIPKTNNSITITELTLYQ